MAVGKIRVSMIGCLPPAKGIASYCKGMFMELKDQTDLEFIKFSRLYPNFLYPGGNDSIQEDEALESGCELEIHGYDVRSWFNVGLHSSGKIVHAQWWSFPLFPAFFTSLMLAKIRGQKIVITVHNILPHENMRIGKITTQCLLDLADCIVLHSESNEKALLASYRIKKTTKVKVIPHGLLSPPMNGWNKEKARKDIGLGSSDKVVLFFGNIRPYKGLDVLIDAMGQVAKANPKAVLLIAGKPWKDWTEYQNRIENNGIQDVTKVFKGFIPDEEVQKYFLAADLVVLPYVRFWQRNRSKRRGSLDGERSRS